ncbi:MAG: ParB/RepB/Spo0J family partition protein [Peptococcaceae bacterium]|nr:ParB/RepB/Spo0J family partition protein [Peptococcaceae bacterium]
MGRGLDALLPLSDDVKEGLREIAVDEIVPNARQARKVFDPEKLDELAASIEEHGLVQPVVVRATEEGFELISGERRWRAYKKLGKKYIPAIVREMDDLKAAAGILIENIQRENLSPLEEAEAYRKLIEEFELTQEEVARRVGKKRTTITNLLRLLKLPPEVQEMVNKGELSAGHARALVGLEPKKQVALAKKVVEGSLSVRAVETMIQEEKATDTAKPRRKRRREDPVLKEMAEDIAEALKTRVAIKGSVKKGKIEISFQSEEELKGLIAALRNVNR